MRRILAGVTAVVTADAAWQLLGAFWSYLLLVLAVTFAVVHLLATAAKASAKAYTTSARVDSLVSSFGSTTSMLSAQIQTLQQGTFVNVNGSTVQITGFGGGNLYVVALKLFTDGNQVNFLNTLNQQANTNIPPTAPSTYSSSWGNGVVGAINNLRNACAAANITHE